MPRMVLANGKHLTDGGRWADPPDIRSLGTELKQRVTVAHAGQPKHLGEALRFEASLGCPLNPAGRTATGLGGRGRLGLWRGADEPAIAGGAGGRI